MSFYDAARENWDKLGFDPGNGDSVVQVGVPGSASMDERDYIYVCGICDIQLHRFRDSSGTIQYVHGRTWERHDHEPQVTRVPKTVVRDADCDFCGITGRTYWVFEGEHIRHHGGNMTQDYGTKWGACQTCSPYIRSGDFEGLFDRIIRVGKAGRGLPPKLIPELRRRLMEESPASAFLATITGAKYVGPAQEPTRLAPHLLPKVQQGLIRFWSNPKLYERLGQSKTMTFRIPGIHVGVENQFAVAYPAGIVSPTRETFDRHAHHLERGIGVSNLYWISEDFTTLATMAGQDLAEVNFTPESLPSRFGLIVWARPIGEVPRPDGMAGIRAVSWTPVPEGIWINLYFQGDDADPTFGPEQRAEVGYLMCPNVGTGWPWSTTWDFNDVTNQVPELAFLRTVFATFFLIQQPGVATETPAPVDKKLARSYARAKKKLPDVKIVDLRRHARTRPETEQEAAERRKISVRFMVRGHWKNQAYGPARSLRKPIYISPFIKGPDDAPFKNDVPTVRVLR